MKLAQRLAIGYIRTKFKLLSSISKKKAAAQAFELFCTPFLRNRKKIPPIFKEAENLEFTLHNQKVKGWRWNHPASKKAMIIHGFESTVLNFDRYIKPLIRKNYEVIAFDAPGHGRSAGKKITAPLYKEMILQIDRKFGPIHSFMAHSFGGLAVSLALEEINDRADQKLVLIAPATETSTAIDSFFRFLRLDNEIRIEFEKIIQRKGGQPSNWYSIRRAMRNIRATVLWFHDEDDDTTPLTDVFKVREENYPHIRFVITKGLGHRRIYRENKVSREVIDFM